MVASLFRNRGFSNISDNDPNNMGKGTPQALAAEENCRSINTADIGKIWMRCTVKIMLDETMANG